MALLKRLSDSFWTYISPEKAYATKGTPQTVPNSARDASPTQRKASLEDVVRNSRSMSPIARVDSWRVGTSSQAASSVTAGRKRKQPHTPSAGAGRRRKIYRMEDDDVDYDMEYDEDEDVEMISEEEAGGDVEDRDEEEETADGEEEGESYGEEEEDEEEVGELSSDMGNVHFRSQTPASQKGVYYDDETEQDTTFVVSEEEYNRISPYRRKVVNVPQEQFNRGVSTEELRAEGWCDDHIVLVQKLAMRGFEPLLPRYWRMDFTYLPDVLFSRDNEAFISSTKNSHMRGIKALQKLFETGGRVRDRILLNGDVTPEQQSKRSLQTFIRWAETDADLDPHTTIPLLAIEARPADTPDHILQTAIHRKMARLYARYHEAFRPRPSIEKHYSSPSTHSTTSTKLSYPVPQIYGTIASHTLVALVAYRPDDTEQKEVRVVAFFDMKDKDYDVWNSVALAVIVCHLRDVQGRMAEETGLGAKGPEREGKEVEDEDL